MDFAAGKYVIGKLGGKKDKLLYIALYHGWCAFARILCKDRKEKKKYKRVLRRMERIKV